MLQTPALLQREHKNRRRLQDRVGMKTPSSSSVSGASQRCSGALLHQLAPVQFFSNYASKTPQSTLHQTGNTHASGYILKPQNLGYGLRNGNCCKLDEEKWKLQSGNDPTHPSHRDTKRKKKQPWSKITRLFVVNNHCSFLRGSNYMMSLEQEHFLFGL